MNSRMVDSGGVKLAVQEHGDPAAPTVLLVHGYPDTSGVWSEVVDILARRYHVVTYDVRGAGQSGRPRRRSAYRLSMLVGDMRAVAEAVSPGKPMHLVGHDWGSVQGWEAITDDAAEQRWASFTSISGPCLDHMHFWFIDHLGLRPRRLLMVADQMRRSWYTAVFQLPVVAPVAWRLMIGRAFGPTMQRLEGYARSDHYPAATLTRDGARGVQLYRANMFPRLTRARERHTTVPVQVIVPMKDRYLSPHLVDGVQRWTDRLWVRRVQTGHWLPRSAPAVAAAMIGDLVDHVDGAPEPRSLRRTRVGEGPRAEHADRLVVVTGSGSGIGRETALAFAGLGADVVVADRDEASAEQTATMVRAVGPAAHVHVLDVSDVTAMEQFAKHVIDEHGVPDIVVNNAGIGIAGAFLDTSAADWQRIVDVNLMGVVHGCRLFGTAMAERREGGHIVNVASAAAFMPSRSLGAYATTKAAVLMLSECVGAELAGKAITVSAICPGIVNTNITRATHYVGMSDAEQDSKRQSISRNYARRNYPPSKVAKAIVKAVREGKPVVPVTPEAHGMQLLARFAPSVMRRLARVDAL